MLRKCKDASDSNSKGVAKQRVICKLFDNRAEQTSYNAVCALLAAKFEHPKKGKAWAMWMTLKRVCTNHLIKTSYLGIRLSLCVFLFSAACSPSEHVDQATGSGQNGIEAERLSELAAVGRWGEGQALKTELSPDGSMAAVITTDGFSIYSASEWQPIGIERSYGGRPGAVDLAADGRTLLFSDAESKSLEIWDLETVQLRYRHPEERLRRFFQLAPNGDRFLTNDGTGLIIAESDGGEIVSTIDLSDYRKVEQVSFSPDGELISGMVGDAVFVDRIVLWSTESGKIEEEFSLETESKMEHRFVAGQFSPDGRYFGAISQIEGGNEPSNVMIWDLQEGGSSIVLAGEESVYADFWGFVDAQTVFVTHLSGKISLWTLEADGGPVLSELNTGETLADRPYFLQDGSSFLVRYGSGEIGRWDVESGAEALRFSPTVRNHLYHLAVEEQTGMALLTGSDGRIEVWDSNQAVLSASIDRYRAGRVQGLDFAADGSTLAAALTNGRVLRWNAAAAQLSAPQELPDQVGRVDTVAYSPAEPLLITGMGEQTSAISFDDSIRIWSFDSSMTTDPLVELQGGDEAVPGCSLFKNQVLFSADGDTFFTVSHNYTVNRWETASGDHLATFAGHTDAILDMTLSPDGQTLFTVSADGSLRNWSVKRGRQIDVLSEALRSYGSLAISPDGQTLFAGSSTGEIMLIDPVRGGVIGQLEGKMNPRTDLEFTPDGRIVVAGSEGNLVRFWSVEERSVLWEIALDEDRFISALALSPDGRSLGVGTRSGTVHLFSLDHKMESEAAN